MFTSYSQITSLEVNCKSPFICTMFEIIAVVLNAISEHMLSVVGLTGVEIAEFKQVATGAKIRRISGLGSRRGLLHSKVLSNYQMLGRLPWPKGIDDTC